MQAYITITFTRYTYYFKAEHKRTKKPIFTNNYYSESLF